MNGKDFDDMCKSNRDYYAREQARLEHIYEQEKAKYRSAPKSNFNAGSFPASANNDANINARLDKIEARIDKLYEMFGSRQGHSGNGTLVVAPSNSNIMANQSITLTDSQFNELMNRLIDD
ncbi:MAG: hypothetical protein IJJ69_12870 [Oscillospiraceae bacterium]|nr:hypothetical protein [Oscillospiraceae bacterium]